MFERRTGDSDEIELAKKLQSHHWAKFFSCILQHHTMQQLDVLKRALPSQLIVQANFSISKVDESFLAVFQMTINQILKKNDKNLEFTIKTLNALFFTNIYAIRFNCQKLPSIDENFFEYFGEKLQASY